MLSMFPEQSLHISSRCSPFVSPYVICLPICLHICLPICLYICLPICLLISHLAAIYVCVTMYLGIISEWWLSREYWIDICDDTCRNLLAWDHPADWWEGFEVSSRGVTHDDCGSKPNLGVFDIKITTTKNTTNKHHQNNLEFKKVKFKWIS